MFRMKRLTRRCPMCKEVMGIVMAERERNVRPVRGFCMTCGYGFRWAVIRSSDTEIKQNVFRMIRGG